MYFKLIKEMPKHNIGDIVYMNTINNNTFYEWVEAPNYILPYDIVEDNEEYFEKYNIDWNIGDKIYFIDSQSNIVEHLFNPKTHIKLVLCNNAFKNLDTAKWVSEKYKMLLRDEIVITNSNDILKIMSLLQSKKSKDVEEAINILNKMIK